MITPFLSWFLPIYFTLFLFIALLLRTLLVARSIGKNPLIFPRTDTIYGLTGYYFKAALAVLFAAMLIIGFAPQYYPYFLPMPWLEHPIVQKVGILLMIIALALVAIAQAQMRDSWRVGIDTQTKTDLVTRGLFQYSRNPIYLGIMVCLIGLFAVLPCGITALFLPLVYVLLQIQIRLEEQHVEGLHGNSYLAYKNNVRRWL